MYLEREGYEVEEAENGEDALAKAFEKDYHCILLDIMMPEKDGLASIVKNFVKRKQHQLFY